MVQNGPQYVHLVVFSAYKRIEIINFITYGLYIHPEKGGYSSGTSVSCFIQGVTSSQGSQPRPHVFSRVDDNTCEFEQKGNSVTCRFVVALTSYFDRHKLL